jgi:hypothetical protein
MSTKTFLIVLAAAMAIAGAALVAHGHAPAHLGQSLHGVSH